MSMVRPSVHPIEAPPLTDNALPRGRMTDLQGMPGTIGGLALRFTQFAFAVVALCVMATTSDFPSVTAFRHSNKIIHLWERKMKVRSWLHIKFHVYLVAAVSLQSLWSLSLAIADVHAILVRRSFRNSGVVSLFSIGDGITSTLTFSAACACAGITVLIGNDLSDCAENHCSRFETATAMAFMSWFAASPSFLLNFWTMASK